MIKRKKKILDFTMDKKHMKIKAKNIKLRAKKGSIDEALKRRDPTLQEIKEAGKKIKNKDFQAGSLFFGEVGRSRPRKKKHLIK